MGSSAASSNRSGLPWFSSKGQIADLVLKILLAVLAGKNAWPQMKQNEFLSAGALLFYGLVATVLISLGILLSAIRKIRHSLVHATAEGGSVSGQKNVVDVLKIAIRSELDRLNPYQLLAVRQLATRGGMTGEQFTGHLHDWGFPIASPAHEKVIGMVFEVINQETTLLTRDDQNLWNLRDRQAVATLFR